MALSKKLAKGDVVEGTVKRLTDFGALLKYCQVSMDLFTYHKFHTNVLKIQKKLLKLVKKLQLKFFNADAERVSLSIKALEERPAQEEGQKEEKRAARPRRPKNVKKKTTSNFQKLKQDSQWLTCSVISNFNQIENSQNPLFLNKGFFLCL